MQNEAIERVSDEQVPVAWWRKGQSWVWLAVLTGVALRLLHFMFLYQQDPLLLTPIVDALAYHEWALSILHDPIGDKVFFQSPGYPYMLALFYAIFGTSWFGVAWFQAALSGLSIWLVARCVMALAEDDDAPLWPAVLAAWCLALYQPLIYYSPLVLKVESTNVFVVLCLYLFLLGMRDAGRALWQLFFAGFSLYFLVLLRGNFLLVFPPLVLWLVCRRWLDSKRREEPFQRRRVAQQVAAFVGGFLLFMSVVTVRNGLVSGQWVTSIAAGGTVLYYGNNPHSPLGDYVHLPFVRPNPLYEEVDFRREAERRAGRNMTTQEASDFWFAVTKKYIFSDPWRSLKRVMHKVRLIVESYEMGDNYSLQFHRLFSWVLWPLLPWWALLLAVSSGTLLTWREHWVRTLPVFIFVSMYAVSMVIFYVISRYRIPLVPMLLLLLAVECQTLHALWQRSEKKALWLHGGLITCVLTCSLAFGLPKNSGEQLGIWWASLGDRHIEKGRMKRGLQYLKKAKAVEPSNGRVWLSLGKFYLRANQLDKAAKHCRIAIDRGAGRQGARECLAYVKMMQKDTKGAMAVFRPLVHDRMTVIQCLLWTALQESSGNAKGAMQTLQKGLRYHGPHPQLYFHMARLLRPSNPAKARLFLQKAQRLRKQSRSRK